MKDRFKQILDEKGLNAQKTASLIGIDASAVSHLLNGKRKPSFEVLDKIGQAFPDINLNWLISGKGTMYNNSTLSSTTSPVAQTNPALLFEEKTTNENTISPESAATRNDHISIQEENSRTVVQATIKKKISRIILFFEDGSFEDYSK